MQKFHKMKSYMKDKGNKLISKFRKNTGVINVQFDKFENDEETEIKIDRNSGHHSPQNLRNTKKVFDRKRSNSF